VLCELAEEIEDVSMSEFVDGNNETVLIVDDNATNREILRRQTAAWRMRGSVAPDGPAALAELRRAEAAADPYRLVLLDMQMPDMDGLEVLEKIKEKDPSIEVVMITATKTVETAVKAMKLGAYDYLVKPVDKDDILISLQRIFNDRDIMNIGEPFREVQKEGVEYGLLEIPITVKEINLPVQAAFYHLANHAHKRGDAAPPGQTDHGLVMK